MGRHKPVKPKAHVLMVEMDDELYAKLQQAKQKGLRLSRWVKGLMARNIDDTLAAL